VLASTGAGGLMRRIRIGVLLGAMALLVVPR
jgi:hypothetical protein